MGFLHSLPSVCVEAIPFFILLYFFPLGLGQGRVGGKRSESLWPDRVTELWDLSPPGRRMLGILLEGSAGILFAKPSVPR